jgi:hypothetical protein
MKKALVALLAVALFAAPAIAGYYEETVSVGTGGTAAVVSGILPIAGTLDRVEVIPSNATLTNTVVVATYTGTTAVDTLVSLSSLVGNKVVRPRIIGTTTAGVNLAAAALGTNDYTVGTALVAPYERPYVGGNIKATVTPDAGNSAAGTVTLRFYFARD